MTRKPLHIRQLGMIDYQDSWQQMKSFTDQRDRQTSDQLWLLQHNPVFTFGQAGKPEHLLDAHNIPVVKSDRGGQVTYHGPGQLIAYPLINLQGLGIGVRDFVSGLEQCVIDTLADFDIEAVRQAGAPGVYVEYSQVQGSKVKASTAKPQAQNNAKIAALGLRVRHGYSFHGLSVNVAMDLQPFQWINPCGYEGMAVTQICDCVDETSQPSIEQVSSTLQKHFCQQFNFFEIGES